MEYPLYLAIIFGIVEGLTEFIPVSSTGHLILAGKLFGLQGDAIASFEIFIQLGAILAVIKLYWGRLKSFFVWDKQSQGTLSGRPGLLRIGIASLPAFTCGYLLHAFIKANLFSTSTVAAGLIAGGIVLIFVERLTHSIKTNELDQITIWQSLGIGILQCAALWPGVSRSGSTIVGGLLFGLQRRAAAEFSFLLAIPVMVGAVLYDLMANLDMFSANNLLFFTTGLVTAFVTALLSIKWFLGLLDRYTLLSFGYYRIVFGALIFLATHFS